MSDWQVGDLAVAVGCSRSAGKPSQFTQAHLAPPRGAIVRVIGVHPSTQFQLLEIEGYPSRHWSRGWGAICFRKILPDKHENCEPEFVQLLKRSKVTA